MDLDQRLTLRSLRVLRRHNRFAFVPVLEIVLDIGIFETLPSDAVPDIAERFLAWLPGLASHRCSLGQPGGFIERLRRGTYFAHICEHLTIELQNRLGCDVGFGRARGLDEDGVYRLVIEYEEAESAIAAFAAATRLIGAVYDQREIAFASELEALQAVAERFRYGPSTAAIVAAARHYGLPTMRLSADRGLVQIGYGKHQRRISAAQTNLTGIIAEEICQEKPLTNRLLERIGLPVPRGRVVASADEAVAVAEELGMAVVIKPADGNQGRGVSACVRTAEEARAAYAIAEAVGGGVLVESYIEGRDYRLLVVGGRMIAAARRDPPQLVGDGLRTVSELVEEANRDPRRRPGHAGDLSMIPLDGAALQTLAAQQLSPETVPERGRIVRLRMNGNLSTGGSATDVTELVYPGNARLAELAVRFIGLDIGGVDLVTPDIAVPLSEWGGAIIEINAAPGLRMHLRPSHGAARDVGRAIIEMLFPDGPVRIPIIAVTGTNGKTTVTRLLAHLFAQVGRVVGMTCTDGIYIDGRRVASGDCAGPTSAETVFMHPEVEVAVLETARGGIIREGLAFDRCDVGVVTNISEDHLGLHGIETIADLAEIKRVVIQAVGRYGTAVLNADDALVRTMADWTSSPVIFFSRDPDSPLLQPHLAEGGRCVVADETGILLRHGASSSRLASWSAIPFTLGGRIGFAVENALAATAAAWAQGLVPWRIAQGLSSFADASMPGRFNVQEIDGCEVVVDYAHNPAAMHALGQGLGARGSRPTTMILGLPGDRRDGDLLAICWRPSARR